MVNWIKKNKIIACISIFTLYLLLIIGIPILINKLYYLKAPFKFLEVTYGIDSILNYYSAVLTFMGTVILGIIAVYQNHISQQKSDKVNELTLELQKKSMAMAELNYSKTLNEEIIKNTPKFEIKNQSSNGNCMNLSSRFMNISSIMVTNILSIELAIINEDDVILSTSNTVRVSETRLLQGQDTRIDFNNAEIKEENVKLVWSFSCQDTLSNIHYLKATLHIKDRQKTFSYLWDIKKVG